MPSASTLELKRHGREGSGWGAVPDRSSARGIAEVEPCAVLVESAAGGAVRWRLSEALRARLGGVAHSASASLPPPPLLLSLTVSLLCTHSLNPKP